MLIENTLIYRRFYGAKQIDLAGTSFPLVGVKSPSGSDYLLLVKFQTKVKCGLALIKNSVIMRAVLCIVSL